MTYSEEFKPEEQEFSELPPSYTIFGVTLTPLQIGIALAVFGLLGCLWLLSSSVFPALREYSELRQQKEEKLSQISDKEIERLDRELSEVEAEIRRVEALRPQILALFAREQTLDTLLLDVNNFVAERNARLVNFSPIGDKPQIVDDGSLGPLVNGKLKRQSIEVEMEGNYAQTQSILRNIERLQPLLVLKEFNSEVSEQANFLFNGGRLSKQGDTTLKTNFRMDMLLPLNEREIAAMEEAAKQAEEEKEAKGKKDKKKKK